MTVTTDDSFFFVRCVNDLPVCVCTARTQAQATATLQALRGGIKTQDDFSKVAMSKSDCSSAKRGGDLGSFARGKMQVLIG